MGGEFINLWIAQQFYSFTNNYSQFEYLIDYNSLFPLIVEI